MTEKQFWNLVKNIQKNNRPKLLAAGIIQAENPEELSAAKRLCRQPCGPNGKLDDLTPNELKAAAQLLFAKETSLECKEIIIMTLAHKPTKYALNTLKKYRKVPDKELSHFVEFAIQECEWWNN
ncbi:MAG: hypothetical protein ABH885_03560 [Candidatus Omnitrophota bacterium]